MRKVRQFQGWLSAAIIWLLNPRAIDHIVGSLLGACLRRGLVRQRKFVLYVGFSHSGKTAHAQQSENGNFAKVDTVAIHEALNRVFPLLDDDQTVSGSGYWPRQFLTQWIRVRLLQRLCRQGCSIVQDSCNLARKERAGRLAIPKKFGYTTTIIHVKCSEEMLLDRLQWADQEKRSWGEVATWVRLYQEIQKPRFQTPTADEADELIEYNN